MKLFAIQEKKNKCYYLSKTTDITNAIDELKKVMMMLQNILKK